VRTPIIPFKKMLVTEKHNDDLGMVYDWHHLIIVHCLSLNEPSGTLKKKRSSGSGASGVIVASSLPALMLLPRAGPEKKKWL